MKKGLIAVLSVVVLVLILSIPAPWAQNPKDILVVAGPRTPESLDQEYPPTEAGHDARRNIYERLLEYTPKMNEDGVRVEDFNKLMGALAESWVLAPDSKSITFRLRKGVKSYAGNELNADDVVYSFERGWNLKANYHWYMTIALGIKSFQDAVTKIDNYTVKVSTPKPSPLLERLWVNNDLGIYDAVEVKKHVTADDPWGNKWLNNHSASYAPYHVTKFTSGQEVIYEANEHYYRGAPKLKKIIFKEIPTSANRLAALQAGSIDVAQWLMPRELNSIEKDVNIKIWKVYGNYIHRVEMCNVLKPFTDRKVRQAINYLVPRAAMMKSVYFDTARPTKSPISEIYPGFIDKYFGYGMDVDVKKAKQLLTEAGFPKGFKTQLGYRSGDQLEEEIAVILKTSFAQAGIELELLKMPASTLVEKYSKAQMPMYFFRDMAIVPDAAYVANLWLHSISPIDYSRYKNPEVDKRIEWALSSTDEPKRLQAMAEVQKYTMDDAPWVFLFNPGYQLATRSNVKGFSWYTPNGNNWYDFYKD